MWEIDYSHSSKAFDFSLKLILRFLPEEFMVGYTTTVNILEADCLAYLIHKAMVVFSSPLPTGALH